MGGFRLLRNRIQSMALYLLRTIFSRRFSDFKCLITLCHVPLHTAELEQNVNTRPLRSLRTIRVDLVNTSACHSRRPQPGDTPIGVVQDEISPTETRVNFVFLFYFFSPPPPHPPPPQPPPHQLLALCVPPAPWAFTRKDEEVCVHDDLSFDSPLVNLSSNFRPCFSSS